MVGKSRAKDFGWSRAASVVTLYDNSGGRTEPSDDDPFSDVSKRFGNLKWIECCFSPFYIEALVWLNLD